MIRRNKLSLFWVGLSMVAFGLSSPALYGESTEAVISVESTSYLATISLAANASVKPNVRFLPKENCWKIDLIGERISSDFQPTTFLQGPLKLVKVNEISQEPPISRISVYVRDNVELKTQERDGIVSFIFKCISNPIRRMSSFGERRSLPLQVPNSENDEIVLELKNSPTLLVMGELAQRSGIVLKFRDRPPAKISLKYRTRNPLKALEKICDISGMVLSKENDGWWLTHKKNPLLKIPSNNEIPSEELFGITNRQAIEIVLGQEFAGKISKKIPREIMDERTFPNFEKISSRRWFEQLLHSHGLNEWSVIEYD